MKQTEHYSNNQGVHIHSIQSGSSQNRFHPLLYLPGALGTAEQFRAEMEALYPRQCLSISLRGRGKSDTPKVGYTFFDHVSDIAAVVNEQKPAPFYLMAYSMSVPYAIQYAIENEEKLVALILCDYPARYPAISPVWANQLLINGTFSQTEKRAITGIQRESAEVELWSRLDQLKLPVYILHGGMDSALLKQDAIELYKEKLENVTFIPFPHSGHELWQPDYNMFIHSIKSILEQHDHVLFTDTELNHLKQYRDSLNLPYNQPVAIEGVDQFIAAGNTASIYKQGSFIIKLFNESLPASEAAREATKQIKVALTGLPVPAVHEITERDGKQAIIMDYVDGRTLGDSMLDDLSTVSTYLRQSIEIQRKIHSKTALIESMTDKLISQLNQAPDLTTNQRALLIEQMHEIAYEPRLCHGDFHLFNIIRSGEQSTIIDWIDASMGDPRADVCRSYLLYQNVSARFAEHYLALYCEGSGTPKSVILQWEPIIAGARLAEGISDNERERLLQIVHRFTE